MREATVLACKCSDKRQTYGMRVERKNGDWYRTWAFKIDESAAKNEGFDSVKIRGSFAAEDGYPGCPYCGGTAFFVCTCGKLNCYHGGEKAKCYWCNETKGLKTVEELDVSGGGY